MTKAKKTLSVLLAVLMVLGTCLFSAFAVAPAENTYTATLTVSPNVQTAKAGDTVTFTVALTTDYAASTASAIVAYDTNVFEAPAVTPSETLFGAFPATEGAAYVNLPANQAGAFVVDKSNNKTGKLQDATLFTVALKVKAGATAGPTTVSVVEDKKAENHEGSLYCGRYDAATNKVVTYGQSFVLNNAEVTIEGGAVAEPNTLLVRPDFPAAAGVVIDKEYIQLMTSDAWDPGLAELPDANATGLVYGIETIGMTGGDIYTFADALTTTAGPEYLKITNFHKDDFMPDGYESTGSKIEVLDPATGLAVETYYFVYFGDLNGDGVVENTDVTAMISYTQNMIYPSLAVMAALDITGDGIGENSDVTQMVTAATNMEGYVDQTTFGQVFNAAYHEFFIN